MGLDSGVADIARFDRPSASPWRSSQCIGRVGGLALALGVGSVIAALPAVAAADGGSGGSGTTSSSANSSAKAGPKARSTVAGSPSHGSGRSAKVGDARSTGSAKKLQLSREEAVTLPVASSHALAVAHRIPANVLGGSKDPLGPAVAPLAFSALALRRDLSHNAAGVVPAAVVTTGEPAAPAAAPSATADPTFWNTQVAPTLTNFIKNGIGYAGQSQQAQAFIDAVLPTFVDVIGAAYLKNPINTQLTNLSNNQTFLAGIVNQVETGLVASGLTAPAAHVAGQAVGYLTQNLLKNTGVQNAVGTLLNTLTVVPDNDLDAFLANLNSPDYSLQDLLQQDLTQSAPAFIAGIPALIGDSGLRKGLFDSIKGAVHVLAGLSGWQESKSDAFVKFVGSQVENAILQSADGNPFAVVVAREGRVAVEHLLSTAAVVDAPLGTVESVVSTFLDATGVSAALAVAANSVAAELAAGTDDLQPAIDAAAEALFAKPAVQAALGQALKAGVTSLADNAALLKELSATATTLLTNVATDQEIKNAVLDQWPAPYGTEIVALLNNTSAVTKMVNAVTTVLPKFFGAKGVPDALGEAVNQIVLARFTSADPAAAVQTIVNGLRTNKAIAAALRSTISSVVRGVLGVQSLERTVARLVGFAIDDILAQSPLNNPTFARVVANALKSVVYTLLADESVRGLIGGIIGDVVTTDGEPQDLLRGLVVRVLSSPGAQLAVGMAVGQAVGSLFGPLSFLVAPVAGIPTGLFIAVNALPVLVLVRLGIVDAIIAQILRALPITAMPDPEDYQTY